MPSDALATLEARALAGMVLNPKAGIFRPQHQLNVSVKLYGNSVFEISKRPNSSYGFHKEPIKDIWQHFRSLKLLGSSGEIKTEMHVGILSGSNRIFSDIRVSMNGMGAAYILSTFWHVSERCFIMNVFLNIGFQNKRNIHSFSCVFLIMILHKGTKSNRPLCYLSENIVAGILVPWRQHYQHWWTVAYCVHE